MDTFYDGLLLRAATIDELLSDDFEVLPGQKRDVDLAARRLAAWCRSCSSGDWSLFNRRLDRDRLSLSQVLAKFATVRHRGSASRPAWVDDAIWIEAAMHSSIKHFDVLVASCREDPYPFEHLFTPVIERAEALLRAGIHGQAFDNLNEAARACLRHLLLKQLCSLSAPAIYDYYLKATKADAKPAHSGKTQRDGNTLQYNQFIAEMKAAGLRRLFQEKPVLLRLIASLTRQWIDTSREMLIRLDADLSMIRRDILHSNTHARITKIVGDLSDLHNRGRSVQCLSFEGGGKVVYKPKDLRVDAAWYNLIKRLNLASPPIELKAVRTISRDGYGWTEFVDHTGCADSGGFERFFRRAGAWLALFHCFAASDMHHENLIAAGDHPVPIDIEMILQAASEEQKTHSPEEQAFEVARETIASSVSMVGLLPAYGRSPENNIFAMGGMNSDLNSTTRQGWKNINSDDMRPFKSTETDKTVPNLPHIDGDYAKFGDHIDNFVSGFEDYANFLLHRSRNTGQRELFDDFAAFPVRKIIRPTRFYYMLLQRLKDHRTMGDGVVWSAQADFIARLGDWDADSDVLWPLQRAERSALVELNVPHFLSPCDGREICDATGISIHTEAASGMDRARARVIGFDEHDIAWQIEVIRQNTTSVSKSMGRAGTDRKQVLHSNISEVLAPDRFIAEAERIARELASCAIRRSPGSAWIGADWLGDSEVSQLVPLGPDLYNGVCGIAVFLAAHAAVTGCEAAAELALAGIAGLRRKLRAQTSARLARSLGIGGATGLGSIVYALTLMSKYLQDNELLADAHVAAELFTDDLITADNRLDVIGGSAGGILGLLRLFRDTRSDDVLKRATRCGEHLLGQRRVGPEGRRSWRGQGLAARCLNGMAHGAAGYAYSLASLSAATGREEFAGAALDCLAFENSSYHAERSNWPDLRNIAEPSWPCQWCHGASGIGLARIGMTRWGGLDSELLVTDIRRALGGVERGWPSALDTLCCGTLGSIEFLREAGRALDRMDLRDLASLRLTIVLETGASTGDYRWNNGKRQFNLGFFRGLAGVGYTFLRQVDGSLANILIWE
jgi:type 2 lantibiotic biosynthesis protein LanM